MKNPIFSYLMLIPYRILRVKVCRSKEKFVDETVLIESLDYTNMRMFGKRKTISNKNKIDCFKTQLNCTSNKN